MNTATGYGAIAVFFALLVIVLERSRRTNRTFLQGLVAYVLGLCVILGLLVWLLTNGHTFDRVPGTFFSLPGLGSDEGPLYLMSIVLTGALGGWCRPDIFVRLFTARSTAAIKRSAVQIGPFLFVFATALTLERIRELSEAGGGDAGDGQSPFGAGSYEIALLAARRTRWAA